MALLFGASLPAADFADLKSRGVIRVLAARASERPGFEREVLEGFARVHFLQTHRNDPDLELGATLGGTLPD